MQNLEVELFQRFEVEIEDLGLIVCRAVGVAVFVRGKVYRGLSVFHILSGNETCVRSVHFFYKGLGFGKQRRKPERHAANKGKGQR